MNHPPLQYGSVCSGIEAVSLAWHPLGMRPIWFSEIAPFPSAVLAHHYPHVPNLGDMTTIATGVRDGSVDAPDIMVGGTPCQSFSIAGARQGLSDPRGALTLSYVELANAIDEVRIENRRPPAAHVWENVPGVLSDRSNAFGCLLGALAGEKRALQPPGKKWTNAGCVVGPRRRVAWRVLDAQYFGVAQRRKRVFLISSGRDGFDPAEVLFERQGLLGDSSPGCAPWQDVARAAGPGSTAAGDYSGLKSLYGKVSVTFCFGGGNTAGPIDVAACLTAQVGTKGDFETDTLLVQSSTDSISLTQNKANNVKGCSEDGSDRDTPIIAFTAQGYGADAAMQLAPTLRMGGHRHSHGNAGVMPAIAFAQNTRGEVRWESGHGQNAGALSTGGGKPGQGLPMVMVPAYEAHFRYTHTAPDAADWPKWRVRRLMPIECERLQGMPDNWTLVPYRGKPAADTPRYKAIGNSMAVPCVAWLGYRLQQALRH